MERISCDREDLNELNYTSDESSIIMETNREESCSPVIKNEKSDSDANSDNISDNQNDDQIYVNNNVSQFYESSDSKIDYAVKLDDNDTLSDIEDIKTDTASADSEDSALGSLPPDVISHDREDVNDRSDGSDSGTETTKFIKLTYFDNTAKAEDKKPPDQEDKQDEIKNNEASKNPVVETIRPQRSSLKRKCEDDKSCELQPKKRKGNIKFDNVTVYYFPRSQGFTCVPSQGGSTLGMEWEHSHSQKFTLTEHALEQRRLHRQILQQLKNERHSSQGESQSSSEESDTEEETSDISESELDLDSYYFLQPVPTRQRRALLRAAGLRKIEGYEKDECRDIRTSREFCGCACKGVCNPENCSCSLAGIKCQVDRLNFPCGCTRDGCGNTTGRIEFNPLRVRTHFINTLMRISLEKKNEEQQEAKRQWAEAHNTNATAACMPNISMPYDKTVCHNQDINTLRDVNTGLPIKSCTSNSNTYNKILCNQHNANISGSVHNEVSFNFQRRDQSVINYDGKTDNRSHDPYNSNVIQGKGPPYPSTSTAEYNALSNSIHRYQCDLNNYMYEQHSENHQYKGIQSFSASSFEEFAHNSQISMFNHYGHMYMPDYVHKQNGNMPEHNAQYSMPQNHYDVYRNNVECYSSENKIDSQYTTLMAMPYQNNKLQALESDENWFCHNKLLNLDNADQVAQDTPHPQADAIQKTTEENVNETENLGELIKKTMVESVAV